MNKWAVPEIRDYLLGRLSDEDARKLEEEMLVNNRVYETVEAVEDDLVAGYFAGTLTEFDRAAFERHLGQQPEVRDKLALHQAFSKLAPSTATVRPADRVRPIRTTAAVTYWRGLAAAAVLVCAVTGWWAVRLQSENQAANERAARLQQQLQSATARQPGAQAPAVPPPSPAPVAKGTELAFLILPTMRDEGARRPEVRVPASQATRVELRFSVGEAPFDAFRMLLRTRSNQVLNADGLRARIAGRYKVVSVDLPPAAPSGIYEATLFGQKAGESDTPLEDYEFIVTRR